MIKRFSDFASEDVGFTGDKLKLDTILGKEIVVKNFKVADSRFNDNKVLTLQFELDGIDYITFTGSGVLLDQVEKYKDMMPFIAKVEKINKFYSFT